MFGTILSVQFTGVKGTSCLISFEEEQSATFAIEAYKNSDEYRVSYSSDALNYSREETEALESEKTFPKFQFQPSDHNKRMMEYRYPELFKAMKNAAETNYWKDILSKNQCNISDELDAENFLSAFKITAKDFEEKEKNILHILSQPHQ